MRRIGHSLAPVASVSGLGDVLSNSDSDVQDGELIVVRSTRGIYQYQNPCALPADGLNVVKSNFGDGSWVLLAPDTSYAAYYTTAGAGALGSGRLLDVTATFIAELIDGGKVWVRSVKDSYTWQATSTATADGLLVVNPTANGGNPGRFIRDLVPAPTWATQISWYIDPANVAANDENSGIDAAHPLKTAAEYDRRNKGLTKAIADHHYYIVSDVLFPDYLRLSGTVPDGSVHHLHGSVTPGHGGTILYSSVAGITARTAMVEASNVRPTITDPSVPTGTWAGAGLIADINHPNVRIRFTSGSSSGAVCWPLKDETGGKVDVTPLSLAPASLFTGYWPSGSFPATITPTVGEQFVVESLVQLNDLRVEMRAAANLLGVNSSQICVLVDSVVVGTLPFGGDMHGVNQSLMSFWGCVNPVFPNIAGSVTVMACVCIGGFPGVARSVHYWQCGILFPITPSAGGIVNVDKSTMAQGCSVVRCIDGGSANVSQACSFDSVDYGIQVVGEAAGIELENGQDGAACLWGTGAAKAGLHVGPGNSVLHNAGTKVITGSGGDFDLAGATTGRAWDETGSAYTAARNCTWALLATTIVGGGFGNCAHNVQENAHIVLEVT